MPAELQATSAKPTACASNSGNVSATKPTWRGKAAWNIDADDGLVASTLKAGVEATARAPCKCAGAVQTVRQMIDQKVARREERGTRSFSWPAALRAYGTTSTSHRDRKRMVQLLSEDVALISRAKQVPTRSAQGRHLWNRDAACAGARACRTCRRRTRRSFQLDQPLYSMSVPTPADPVSSSTSRISLGEGRSFTRMIVRNVGVFMDWRNGDRQRLRGRGWLTQEESPFALDVSVS